MMRHRRRGKGHEIAGPDFDLFTVNLSYAAAGQNVKPLFFMMMGVIDEGFLTWRHARDIHCRSLQAECAAKLHTNQLRLRIPRMGERLFTLLDLGERSINRLASAIILSPYLGTSRVGKSPLPFGS